MTAQLTTTEERIAAFLRSRGIHEHPAQFVALVTNIYHGYEAQFYDAQHSEIQESSEHWQHCLQTIQPLLPNKINALDVGTGTGFASSEMLRALNSKIQNLVCQDYSPIMVATCRDKLTPLTNHAMYVSGDINCLQGGNNRFDLVVTNAVLHHILDLSAFLATLGRLVKVGGFYIAGHEPSRGFYESNQVHKWHKRYRRWRQLRRVIQPNRYLSRLGATSRSPNLDQLTNAKLIELGRIHEPLPPGAVSRLVDIHVPPLANSRPFWGELGFDAEDICQKYLLGFEVFSKFTYSHIKDARARMGYLWRAVDMRLAKQYPTLGADVIMAFRRVQ